MWWVTEEDSQLRSSPTIAAIDRVYRATDGYVSYFLALMLKAMGTAREGETRVAVPRNNVSVVWRGPEDRFYPLSISQEKGIRFFLPIASTTVRFREEFWRLFAGFAEEKRSAFVSARLPGDDPSSEYPGGPVGWWEAAKNLFERLGGKDSTALLGAHIIEK